MVCPACKSDIIVVEYHNIELDYCTGCKGVWFDSGELELMLKSHNVEGTNRFLENITSSPEARSTEKKRKCPICRRRMEKKTMGEPPPILVDMCRHGHGLWFDGGEVAQLIKNLAGERRPIKSAGAEVLGFLEEIFKPPPESGDN